MPVAPVVTPSQPASENAAAPVVAPVAPVVAPVVTPEPSTTTTTTPAAETAVSGFDETAVNTMLSPEEQREVAFKVVGFFIMLIIASFVILYIYHTCSQKKIKSRD